MLGVMNLGIKFLWLADDEWILEGHKLPCEFNDFPKMVFTASLQYFFHLLVSFSTQLFPIYLQGRKLHAYIILSWKCRILDLGYSSIMIPVYLFFDFDGISSSHFLCFQTTCRKEQTITSTNFLHFFCLF